VTTFKNKALECDKMLNEIEREIRDKAESEVATQDEKQAQHITPNFWKTVLLVSIKPDNEHRYELVYHQGSLVSQIWAGNFISLGIESEKKHREFIGIYSQDKRCKNVALLLLELDILKDEIHKRIRRCIEDSEYIHSYCVRCPTEQRVSHKGGSET
jgi:hypothetical protein